MINFSLKTGEGKEILGLALGGDDIEALRSEGKLVFNLESVGVGLWRKEADGSRTFMQPRDSQMLIFRAETTEEIGEVIGVELPGMEELRRRREQAEAEAKAEG